MNTTEAPPKGPPDLRAYRDVLKHERAALTPENDITICEGKAPIVAEWQNITLSADEANHLIDTTPHPAIGIKLGPGGAIDFDVDGPDEKVAFRWLFEDDPLPMPNYTSGREGGEHHLAAFHPRLAVIGKASLKVRCPTGETVTVRLGAGGKGAQSILPPSYHSIKHEDGSTEWTGPQYQYKPYCTLEEIPPPTLPDSVVNKILAAAGPAHHEVRDKHPPQDGDYGPGNRHDHLCSVAAKIRNAGCGFETILAAVDVENRTRCNPPKSDHEVRDIAKYYAAAESTAPPPPNYGQRIERLSFAELAAAHPVLRPPVIDGLLRQGETMNLISSSKVGKSWLMYLLLLSVVTGRYWLDRFATRQGKCLLVDNELHGSTLANRIPTVATAMHLDPEQYDLDLEVMSLRGRLKTLDDLKADLDRIEPGEFAVIGLDARYRFAKDGESENDNAAQARFYNLVDQIAERTGSAIVLVHHSSKGSQGDKKVVDVGAGAGSQSRAADCHLVLREHQDDNAVVLDAAVRSFKPVEPLVLKWSFPLWLPDTSADPLALKGISKPSDEQRERIKEEKRLKEVDRDKRAVVEAMAKLKVAETQKAISETARISGGRAKAALVDLMDDGQVREGEPVVKGNRQTYPTYELVTDYE